MELSHPALNNVYALSLYKNKNQMPRQLSVQTIDFIHKQLEMGVPHEQLYAQLAKAQAAPKIGYDVTEKCRQRKAKQKVIQRLRAKAAAKLAAASSTDT